MKRVVWFQIILAISISLIPSIVLSESINIRWTPRNPQNSVSGYQVYVRLANLQYGRIFNVTTPGLSLQGLPPEKKLIFSIVSNLTNGTSVIESPTVSIVIPDSNLESVSDGDGDGIEDGVDNCVSVHNPNQLDASGNGVGDVCESGHVPNPTPVLNYPPNPTPTPTPTIIPQNPGSDDSLDSDGDGVSDSEELQKGTNPYDRGSSSENLLTQFCAEWNGFISHNYAEVRNLSNRTLFVVARLHDGAGVVRGQASFSVAAGAQFDLPVHTISGFQRDSYGRLCFSHNGSQGEIDGQVSIYQPDPVANSFQFAYSSDYENGKKGEVVLPLNSFNPNFTERNANFVANWVQITNLNEVGQSGTLFMYAQNGQMLNQIRVVLEAGQRKDFSAHQFGRLVGMIRWVPDSNQVRFLTRVVRYIYDNNLGRFSFDTAAKINAQYATGENIYIPFSTEQGSSIIEVMNATSRAMSASVEVRSDSGALLKVLNLSPAVLPAFGSYHVILDEHIGSGKSGVVIVRGAERDSIAAVGMAYNRGGGLDVMSMYAVEGKVVAKQEISGSYNTNIGIKPYLIIANTANSVASFTLEMTRSSGEKRGPNRILTIPAYGRVTLDLSQYEDQNVYGAVKVVSDKKIVGGVMRERGLDFTIPTDLK